MERPKLDSVKGDCVKGDCVKEEPKGATTTTKKEEAPVDNALPFVKYSDKYCALYHTRDLSALHSWFDNIDPVLVRCCLVFGEDGITIDEVTARSIVCKTKFPKSLVPYYKCDSGRPYIVGLRLSLLHSMSKVISTGTDLCMMVRHVSGSNETLDQNLEFSLYVLSENVLTVSLINTEILPCNAIDATDGYAFRARIRLDALQQILDTTNKFSLELQIQAADGLVLITSIGENTSTHSFCKAAVEWKEEKKEEGGPSYYSTDAYSAKDILKLIKVGAANRHIDIEAQSKLPLHLIIPIGTSGTQEFYLPRVITRLTPIAPKMKIDESHTTMFPVQPSKERTGRRAATPKPATGSRAKKRRPKQEPKTEEAKLPSKRKGTKASPRSVEKEP